MGFGACQPTPYVGSDPIFACQMDATEQQHDLNVSRTEHDDGWMVAADLHPLADDEVTVELIEDTAVVAIDTPMFHSEIDIELPDSSGAASLRNGVLVIESPA